MNNIVFFGEDGKDGLRADCSHSTLDGGSGDDNIVVDGSNNLICLGDGNDFVTINAYETYKGGSRYSTIYGNEGNDTIHAVDDYSLVHTGSGNNYVYALNDATIYAGSGDNTIRAGKNSVIFVNGNNSSINAGTNSKIIKMTGLNDLATSEDFSLSGNVVTLKKAAIDSNKVSILNNYTLALDDDVEKVQDIAPTWKISQGTASYKVAGKTAGYVLSDDKKTATYNNAVTGDDLFTITGLKSGTNVNNISLKDKVVTLKAAALDKSKVTISNDYTLALASDVKQSEITAAEFTVSGTKATYKTEKITKGYALASNKKSITYTQTNGGDILFTVKGLKKNTNVSNLTLKNKVVTLKAAALNITPTIKDTKN